MHFVNEIWAAKVLNMQINPKSGPDLIDNRKALEVKFEKTSKGVSTHRCWKILGHQLGYDKDYKEIYWGLGFYELNTQIKNVREKDLINLEKIVNYREMYIVEWNWMQRFPLYHQKGKTSISEWDHFIGYPKFKLIPHVISSKEVQDGKIFFTEGVNPEIFKPSEENAHQNPYKDAPFQKLMTEYETLLDDAYTKVKVVEGRGGRFEVPQIEGHVEGKKTILTNFLTIASYIRRDPEHFQKFILKELATSGQREGDRLILNNKIPSSKINAKIEQYLKEFVICKECGKPDTELKKENRLNFINCLACGAKHPVREKI